MADTEQGTWTTTTGLLDEWTGVVSDAHFKTDAQYQNGEVLILQLDFATEDSEDGTWSETFPCGKGWSTKDGGKNAKHESGAARGFNKATAMGKLIDRCVGELGMMDVLGGRGPATKAEVWVGLNFHFKRETEEYEIRGEKRTSNRALPIEFLGEGEGESKPAAKASGTAKKAASSTAAEDKVAAAKAKAAAKKAAEAGGGDEDPIKAALTSLATEHDTHEAFLDAAMEVEGVMDDDDLLASVVDESEDGFYSQARS